MGARQFIIVGAACLLAACAGSQNTSTPPQPTATATVKVPPQTAPTEPTREPVREAVRAAPAPIPTPDTLVGLASNEVDNLLGPPDLVRLDGPAEVRLYRAPATGCTFHVFLYVKDAAARTRAVEYYEARNLAGRLEGAALADCYRALVKPAKTS
jgi:hypothetical protein